MQLDDQIAARMRELAIYHRASLIGCHQAFDTGKIAEHSVNRDIQTLTAFIDATPGELPDDVCTECLCHLYSMTREPPWTGGHGWHCSKDPNSSKESKP